MLRRCLSLVCVIELQICADPIPTLIERCRAPFHFAPPETRRFSLGSIGTRTPLCPGRSLVSEMLNYRPASPLLPTFFVAIPSTASISLHIDLSASSIFPHIEIYSVVHKPHSLDLLISLRSKQRDRCSGRDSAGDRESRGKGR